MAEIKVGKRGGSKLVRTEMLTVRLDPKLRYLAGLAARRQRRTLSSFIEWAVSESIQTTELAPGVTVESAAAQLWDIDPAERLDRLAQAYPHLLTYDEEQLLRGESAHGQD